MAEKPKTPFGYDKGIVDTYAKRFDQMKRNINTRGAMEGFYGSAVDVYTPNLDRSRAMKLEEETRKRRKPRDPSKDYTDLTDQMLLKLRNQEMDIVGRTRSSTFGSMYGPPRSTSMPSSSILTVRK